MTDRPTFYFRVAAAVLALLGLGPFVTLGLTSGDWSVLRLAIIDPLVVIAFCVAVAFALPGPSRRLLRGARDRLLAISPGVFVAGVAVFIVVAAVAVSHVAFAGQPAYSDEYTQAFQGRIISSGHLAAVAEPYPEFFETAQTVRHDGRWFGMYPILSGVMAAAGDAARIAWLINPLWLAVAAVATWAFARRAYDELTGRIAMLLMALSPFAVFMGATRMSHVPTLALTMTALAWLVTLSEARGKVFPSLGIGMSLGLMGMLRPYDAALVAIPIGIFVITSAARDLHFFRTLGITFITALALVSIQLWVNSQTTGRALLFGYDAINGIAHRPGFHINPLGLPFTPSDGFDYVVRYLSRLNTALFESVVPSVVFIAGAMWLTRPTKWDWLLAGLIFTVLAGYGIYWVDGTFLGPRFLYTAAGAFVIFAARFVVLCHPERSPSFLGVNSGPAFRSRWSLAASLVLPVCLILAFVPSTIGNRSTGIWLRLDGLRRILADSPDPRADVERAGLTNALVFVREPLHSRIAARFRALGTAPYDAERMVADMDACTLLVALARSDSRPDIPAYQRRLMVIQEGLKAGQGRMVPGLVGASALTLTAGPNFTQECRDEINGDRNGVEAFERFLALSSFDQQGRLGGDVVFARYLGARDTILRSDPRFANRQWYLYRRDPGSRDGRFEPMK